MKSEAERIIIFKQRGFTLIELLVVIAVIALLMAILMPALSRVRNQAKSTACRAKLKQWGAILLMYADDNNARFTSRYKHWMNELRPYYKDSNDLRLCPMATKPVNPEPVPAQSYIGGKFKAWGKFPAGTGVAWMKRGDYGSYGINNWMCHRLGTDMDSGIRYWRTPNVKKTGNIPMFLDCIAWGARSHDGPLTGDDPPPYEGGLAKESGMCYYCIDRHNGFINAVFLDSSARKVGLKELWTLNWNVLFRVNGPWTVTGGIQPADWPPWMRKFPEYK